MSDTAGTVEYAIPSSESVNEATKEFQSEKKNYLKLPENLAGNFDLTKKFQTVAYGHFQKFVQQPARTELMEYLANADAKYRMAQSNERRFKSESKQKQPTLTQVTSSQFYESVRLITAGQRAIVFSDPDEIPAAYFPFAASNDYTGDEGKRIAEGQNLWLNFVWNKEDWTTLIKKLILFNNKNSIEMVTIEWDRRLKTTPERVPGWYDEGGEPVEYSGDPSKIPSIIYDSDGKKMTPEDLFDEGGSPISYVFVDKVREVKNWPVLKRRNMKDSFLDLGLNDIQDSTCLTFRSQQTFGELLDMQKQGYYENVDLLGKDQLFSSETQHGETLQEDRTANAGQTHEDVENGLFDVYHTFMIAPIKNPDDAKKAKWDQSAIPQIFESVFVGKYGSPAEKPQDGEKATGAVCVQLRKLPYHHGKFPAFMLHSNEDEKGLVSMGYYSLLECNVEEQTVTIDQMIQNKTLGIKSPFIGEKGNVLSAPSEMVFDPNKVLWVRAGTGRTALTKMEIPNMVQRTVEEIAMLENKANKSVGTIEAIQGMFAGSRTTGTEYLGAREQAMKPAVEDCKAVMVPFFNWLLDMVARLGRQFCDPRKKLVVTNGKGEFIGEVNVGTLYGELQTRVVSIDKFEADIIGRQIIVNFIQAGGYDKSEKFMGRDGALYFWRETAKRLKLPNPDKIYPENRRYVEAENQALADYRYILEQPIDAMRNPDYLPKEGEMHDIHISVLSPYRDRLAVLIPTLSDIDRDKAALQKQALDLYILIHEQMRDKEAAGAVAFANQQQAAGQPGLQQGIMQAQETPTMEGEAAGDIMAGVGQQTGAA